VGAATKIEWCDHTFNPWWGCTEVSPLCDHCYAMMLDVRWFKGVHWGAAAPRRYFGNAHWRAPLKWDHLARAQGGRNRVFCASMADVFDKEVDQALRDRLWSLVRETPNLDWVILTKRIGNAPKMLPADWGAGYPNVWLLVSVDQVALERDTPKLLAISAAIHGVSIEPQLAPVCLGEFAQGLEWVIVGGESGAGARPFHLEWARLLIAECAASGTAIFVQKMGCKPFEHGKPLRLNDYAGGDMMEWPADLRVRQFPVEAGKVKSPHESRSFCLVRR
jgi:protein gp37